MRTLGAVEVLILDDWGLEPLGPKQRRDLLELMENRYGRGTTLITSRVPVDRWHDLIGNPTLTDAILDRLAHDAHRIQLRGESLRRKRTAATAPDAGPEPPPDGDNNLPADEQPPGRHQSE